MKTVFAKHKDTKDTKEYLFRVPIGYMKFLKAYKNVFDEKGGII
jgi:hypothetical protein